MKLTLCLQIAGVGHIFLLVAGGFMPVVVRMREHLRSLPLFLKHLFWTYYIFIGLCIVAFGSFTFFYAPEIASGNSLARALSIFLAAFWALRLLIALFIFEVRPYLTSPIFTLGYIALNGLFLYFFIVYSTAAFFR